MKYQNPIIRGFNPDPSICRVGEDYYLVTSSFEYFPGIPIYHSRDLVNWEQIGNCVQNPADFPYMNVADSGGIWAPTIRYENGVFYVTATFDTYGNFIIHTKDPRGKWSKPVWVLIGGIDPSIFFEDGHAYYCTNQTLHHGQEEISLYEIDVESGVVFGEGKTLWGGIGGGHLEAPHVYHVGEWYYLLTAEGGTFFNHMATIARSKDLWGPYEGWLDNPVLTNAHDTSKAVLCAGHGDLFCDHFGNWWMVHLAIRLSRRTMSHLGRETFLTPVIWQDGWPIVENHRKAVLECDGPLWMKQKADRCIKADFNKTQWEPEWIFLRNPREDAYVRGDGKLLLIPAEVHFADQKNPVFAAVRQGDFNFELNTEFIFAPCEEGDEAGVAIVLSSRFYYCFAKKRIERNSFLVLEKNADDMYQRVCKIPLPEGKINLRIRGEKEYYYFSYSMDGEGYCEIARASTRFLACEVSGKCFTGTVTGVYAASCQETEAVMCVKTFELSTVLNS